MTESSGSSGRHAGNQAGVGRQTWTVTRAIRRAISRGNAQPPRKDARETDSRRRRNRRGTPRGCRDRGVGHDRKWPLPPWKDWRERGQLPGRYGIGGIHPGGTQMEGMGPHGGRADPILGASVFGGRTSAGVSGQSAINRDSGNPGRRSTITVAEIRDDEGISGNDFAMAHELTVRPCEGAVYLPDHAETGRGHLGECLPCTVRVVTEVRTITEETMAVRAVGPATLALHAVSQVRVIVPNPRAWGTVMVDRGPGPLGLCPVGGIVEVEQASNI